MLTRNNKTRGVKTQLHFHIFKRKTKRPELSALFKAQKRERTESRAFQKDDGGGWVCGCVGGWVLEKMNAWSL